MLQAIPAENEATGDLSFFQNSKIFFKNSKLKDWFVWNYVWEIEVPFNLYIDISK